MELKEIALMTLTTDQTEHQSIAVPLGDQPPFLTVQQASKLLQVSTWVLYQAIRAGELPVIRWGRRVVLQREDLAAFVLSRRDEGLRGSPRMARLNIGSEPARGAKPRASPRTNRFARAESV